MSKYVHILIVIAFLQAPCSSTDLSNMPPPSDIKELAIDDLKDLLITSIQNTMSLQNLVTQQTQMIVNIMLLVGETSNKVVELETTLTREMENLKATMNEEVVVLKLKLETLEDSTEVDRHSLEILTESVQVLKTNSRNMQTEVGGTTEKVEELETTLTREMENTKANKRSLVTLTETVQALQTNSSNMQTEVGGTTDKVEELETTLTREMENTKANKRSLVTLTESVQALQTTSSNVKTEVEELETTLTREIENTKANKRSLVTLTESVQALQTTSSNVMILNGEESAGNARCAKVCAGTTGRSSTSHSRYGSEGIQIDVNISGCGFVKIPTITTSVEGRGAHDTATGTSSVYYATRTGFRMYLRNKYVSNYANVYKWNVEWVAIGYTC